MACRLVYPAVVARAQKFTVVAPSGALQVDFAPDGRALGGSASSLHYLAGLPFHVLDQIRVRLENAPDLAKLTRDGSLRVGPASDQPLADAPSVGDGGTINPFEEPKTVADPPRQAAKTWFEVRLIDDAGDPIEGVEVKVSCLGETTTLDTDGDGKVRLDDCEGGFARAMIVDPKALREKLKPMWVQPRQPKLPESTSEAPIHPWRIADEFDPVLATANSLTTIAVLPRLACREVPSVSFEFARSFVRREAVGPLAAIAAELRQDDGQKAMLFGHTDKAGTERLNKRLSERRARTVLALLTHDGDAFAQMWAGKASEKPWRETWGTREAQHMLNALGCGDAEGQPVSEDGDPSEKTQAALSRFQRGDFSAKPPGQSAIAQSGSLDDATLKALFLAYAKLITREPVDAARFEKVGGESYVGCGEFNPLSLSARDSQSRRVVVFIFDPAAVPSGMPCALGDIGPCHSHLKKASGMAPFYRCSAYKKIGCNCDHQGGVDLSHDVLVRFFFDQKKAGELPHTFVFESEDLQADAKTPTIKLEAKLADKARVLEGQDAMVELHFPFVPAAHKYRLRAEGSDPPHTVFAATPFRGISDLSAPSGEDRWPRLAALLAPPADLEAAQ